MSKNLFDPVQLGPIPLKNRIVMAPMTRNRAAAENVPGDLTPLYYRQRSTAGLIITEASQIMPEGQGYPNTPGIYSAKQVEGWKRVTQAVHEEGGKIFLQLWHVGRVSHSLYQPGRALPVAPSAVAPKGEVYTLEGMKPYETPRALDIAEIPLIVEKYRQAALNAKEAGFDGVEVHAANGYLIDQFLQDGTNRRSDAYGGSVENRARFLLEVTQAVISVWGADRVGVRLSPNGSFNSMSDSNPEATFTYAVRKLNELGIVYLHLRTGTDDDVRHGRTPVPIEKFRALFSGHVMFNDQFTRAKADEWIAKGLADSIAFGSVFIANPDLPQRLLTGAALNAADISTFYGGGAKGYTDYPTLKETTHVA